MLKRQADRSVQLSTQADGQYLEHRYCENVREIYRSLCTSNLAQFTSARLETWWDELNELIHDLERLPESAFTELIDVIDRLREARNELRLALFLLDVEEIDPVYRLIMRNRAVLRGRDILHRTLRVWPAESHS